MGGIVNAEEHGDESRIEARVVEALIQERKHAGRIAVAVDNDFPDRANGE